MKAITSAVATVTTAASTRVIYGPLQRLCNADPLFLAFMIAAAALVAMFCLFALAEVVTLIGGQAFGDFIRDAGQQVGGAGGLGAAGAGAAGGADEPYDRASRTRAILPDYRTVRQVPYTKNEYYKRTYPDGHVEYGPPPFIIPPHPGPGPVLRFSRWLQRWAEWYVGNDIIGTVPGGAKA